MSEVRISPLSRVSQRARLGAGVVIGDFTVVHDDVELGDGTVVESHCVIGKPTPLAVGEPLVLGAGALVRSHSVLYQGSRIGPGLRTGHGVVIRERLVAGPGLQIGTQSDIQGSSTFGDHVRTHSQVFVAQGTTIGNYCWLFPRVQLTDDPHPPSDVATRGPVLEDYAALGAGACVLSGVRIGTRSLVAAGSVVRSDVAPDLAVGGVPARVLCKASEIKLRDGSGAPAYPWMRHFHRGYPPEVVEKWLREYGP